MNRIVFIYLFIHLFYLFNSGHYQYLKIVSVIERCPLRGTSSQVAFASKACFWPQTKKEHKNNIVENIMFIWYFGRNWLASVGNVCRSQPTKLTRMLLLWFTPILTVKKEWLVMSLSALNIFATGKLVNYGGKCGLEIPEKFQFYRPESFMPLNWLKK